MSTEGEVIDLLYALVRVQKPEVVVETGTYHGHGAQAIAEALKANRKGHLYTVEYEAEYVYGRRDEVTYVCADSIEWSRSEAPDSVDFAFVDCCEDPAGRVTVFDNLYERLSIGGFICAHDTAFYRDEDYLRKLEDIAGRYTAHFPALNGFTFWQR